MPYMGVSFQLLGRGKVQTKPYNVEKTKNHLVTLLALCNGHFLNVFYLSCGTVIQLKSRQMKTLKCDFSGEEQTTVVGKTLKQ